jgi:hypothetical protein
MSTAWRGSVVLLREPPSAFWSRFGYRLFIAAALALAAYVLPWAWLAVPVWIFAGLMALLAVLAIANIIKNRRALLVLTGAGSIEWPKSIQEIVLRRPVDWVAAREIVLTHPPIAAMPGQADPRITLSDGERSIERVPLYGKAPAEFVDEANALLVGRGVTLRFEAPPTPDAEAAE